VAAFQEPHLLKGSHLNRANRLRPPYRLFVFTCAICVFALFASAADAARAPGSPRAVSAKRGDTLATVDFMAPASDGGSPITGYTVISHPGGVAATGPQGPITVTGLTNALFRVTYWDQVAVSTLDV
jgi:hypothetical protein